MFINEKDKCSSHLSFSVIKFLADMVNIYKIKCKYDNILKVLDNIYN